MSSGNNTIDQAIANAGQALAQQWWNPATAPRVQPDNNLKPDANQLQFRVKMLEDRIDVLERLVENVRRR